MGTRHPVLLLLTLTCVVTTLAFPDQNTGQQGVGRALLQAGVSCALEIPSCADGHCTFATLNGGRNAMCDQCKTGYTASRNRLHCVCAPGTYEKCDVGNTCQCLACDTAFFCPGGKRTAVNFAVQAERGQRFSCHKATVNADDTTQSVNLLGLTTPTTNATGHAACRTMPGFYLKSNARATQQAALCSNATYSPGSNRLLSCRKCPTGTEADATLSDASRRTSVADTCRVPAGRYWALTYAKKCPTGTYRPTQLRTTEAPAASCLACPKGFTTAGQGTTLKRDCSVGMPGYDLKYGNLMGEPVVEPQLCAYGFYYTGGPLNISSTEFQQGSTCIPCPSKTATKSAGSTDITDCMVPPGFYIKKDVLRRCPESLTKNGTSQGYYRAGWALYSDQAVIEPTGRDDGSKACTACGSGIFSQRRHTEEFGSYEYAYATTDRNVASSIEDCYYQPGQGLIQDPANPSKLMAADCPVNMYGQAGSRGLDLIFLTAKPTITPCTACPPNLVAPAASTTVDSCTNQAGYSYDTVFGSGQVLSSQCIAGYYNPAASQAPCAQCPVGRTTTYDSTPSIHQASINNCFVMPGYGLYFTNSLTPWVKPDNVTVTITAIPQAFVKVFECPQGYYGLGGSVTAINSYCVACPAGYTTPSSGSTQASDCNACAVGYDYNAAQCQPCPLGTYQDTVGLQSACTACGSTTYIYFSLQGQEQAITSSGTTLQTGSTAAYQCVAKSIQLDDDIGQTMALDNIGTWSTAAAPKTMSECIATCSSGECCITELTYTSAGQGTCKTLKLAAVAPGTTLLTGSQLYFNIPATAGAFGARKLMGDSAVEAKAITPSGYYARCEVPATDDWEALSANPASRIGKALDGVSASIYTDVPPQQCQDRCSQASNCWGFFFKPTGSEPYIGKCLLRAGEADVGVRSFFTLPF